HLVGPESQPRGEVYAAANDRFQSGRLFNEIAAIVERTSWLAARVSIRRHVKELEDIGGTGSLFAALSADVPTKHGLAPHFGIVDELGQSQSRELLDALETGLGKRKDPMLWVISTQAATDSMPMSELVDYGLRVRRGEIVDPSFHLVLYTAPPDADPWSRKTWKLANPGLDDILSLEHVKRLAKQAKNVPAPKAVSATMCSISASRRRTRSSRPRYGPPATAPSIPRRGPVVSRCMEGSICRRCGTSPRWS